MGQNQMLLLVMAAGCGMCMLYGIWKHPMYLVVLISRGIFCSVLIIGIQVFCEKNGFRVPLDLNAATIGTGALLGFPGIVALYAAVLLL